jgi:hypothetical protein
MGREQADAADHKESFSTLENYQSPRLAEDSTVTKTVTLVSPVSPRETNSSQPTQLASPTSSRVLP